MSTVRFKLPRVEGGLYLEQDDDGRVRLAGPPPRRFEARLAGRGAWDAVYLTQLVAADEGLSHALAAVTAWEAAMGLTVAENGRVLRELMHTLSLLHAHVRHFYQQALPDYLPYGTLADYEGSFPHLSHLAAGLADQPKEHWSRQRFDHPFQGAEVRRLWEHTARALATVPTLQRMLAIVGGKYPVVMSVVPGGVNVTLTADKVLTLRGYLNDVRDFLEAVVPADAELVVQRYKGLKGLGRGRGNLLCAGTGEDDTALESSLFPSGVFVDGKLERFSAVATEAIENSLYRMAAEQPGRGRVVVPAPDKSEAYSWIKAPRYKGRALETGPLARLLITYLSGARMRDPTLAERIEDTVGQPLQEADTVAGRMLARMHEPAALVERCEVLLDQLDPAHPTVQAEASAFRGSGEGTGHMESPAGAVQHRVALEEGRVQYYDIIAASTWNGTPTDAQGETGGLETALNAAEHDLRQSAQRREVSRIVQSFAFSMADAVQ